MISIVTSPLVGPSPTATDRRVRAGLFILWLVLVAWFLSDHAFWRDEIRAYSLALSGDDFGEMLANVQGEGHPALWYLLLRSLHDIAPYREVLPVAGAVIGVAAMAMLTFLSPFRPAIIALILFSAFGAFEYVVIARNYGIAALLMFAIAALYPKVRNRLWLGLLIALLANTNVPSAILAGCLLFYRLVELICSRSKSVPRDWLILLGNSLISAVGAWISFRTVYPTFNDSAVSSHLASPGLDTVLRGLIDTGYGFYNLGIWPPLAHLVLLLCCLAFIQRPAALGASLLGFVALKLFFYMVYLSYYRHEVQFIAFLIMLHWIVAQGAERELPTSRSRSLIQTAGRWAFVALLCAQTIQLFWPIHDRIVAIPYSRSADLARVLQRPEYRRAIVMADPDTLLEPLPYYVDNPLWLLREEKFGRYARLSKDSRSVLTPDSVLKDARMLHRQTGRPIIYLSHLNMERPVAGRYRFMFHNVFVVTAESRESFRASTRLVTRLRRSRSGEHYDVYVYPR